MGSVLGTFWGRRSGASGGAAVELDVLQMFGGGVVSRGASVTPSGYGKMSRIGRSDHVRHPVQCADFSPTSDNALVRFGQPRVLRG